MSACHLYDQVGTVFRYYCEINNKLYGNIAECVQNCGIGYEDVFYFHNVGYEGYFLIVFGLAFLFVWGLMYVLLDW